MRYQPIYDIASLCVFKNIKHVVLCPGSRCAPLTLAFTRHPKITTKTFSDERSAGFIALGMAQATGMPVVVVCTSGTAAYNLAPSIAEAHFSGTPLLIFTADRPAEWIAQHDGQTVYQTEMFGNHVKKFFQLPQDYEHPDSQWAINRMVNEAVNLSLQAPRGPVHINAPFREPLYPSKDEKITFSPGVRVIEGHEPLLELKEDLKTKIRIAWSEYHNILLVAGQQAAHPQTIRSVAAFQQKHQIPVVHDIISNLHEVKTTIQHSDFILDQASDALKQTLRPDLLITFGQSLVSKNLKIFLRKYPAKNHWHIQTPGDVADTFKNVREVFFTSPHIFLDFLTSVEEKKTFDCQKQANYFKLWDVEETRISKALDYFFKEPDLTELQLVKTTLESLPDRSNLHLANSMSVRYANLIGLKANQKDIQVFSNRGTSGIDGCTSTTIGHCLSSDRINFLITGDLAFFYDRNAFWHNYPLHNLRILLLNNHGGLIFDVLDGPSSLPEAKEYFITRQLLNAKKLCEEFGFDHLPADPNKGMKSLFRNFFKFDNSTKIMEFESDTTINKKVFDKLKLTLKKNYEF